MLDTLALAKGLATAGMPQPQAEAISRELATALNAGDIATKQHVDLVRKDLDLVRKDLENSILAIRNDIETVEARLRGEIASSRNQTILAMIAVVGIALAIARFMF